VEPAYLSGALEDLRRIDKRIAARIIEKIAWLALNADVVTHIPLASSLSDFYKLRVGDWRILYEVDRASEKLVIHKIGHRRDIYK
jgi:mRNA interferase RelE/StbE